MTASIGELEFAVMTGSPAEAAMALEVRERQGEDGAEARQIGLREPVSELRTLTTVADASAAAAAVADQAALAGTIVSVVDAHGTTHPSVLIVEVWPAARACGKPTTDPDHTYRIETRWVVRKRLA